MKRVLLIFFFILVAGAAKAAAVEFKTQGQWVMSFGYGMNGSFEGSYKGHQIPGWGNGQDSFEPASKITLNMHANVSDTLSGVIGIEMGDIYLGQAATGGALGADSRIVEVSLAYLDWQTPKGGLKVRMGLQDIVTPALASGNNILNDTVAGIAASFALAEGWNGTLFWARPYNMNYNTGFMDNADAFGLMLPLEAQGYKLIPWGMFAEIGPNTLRAAVDDSGYPFGNAANFSNSSYFTRGMFPAGGARHRDFTDANTARKLDSYGQAWWAGFSGRMDLAEFLRVAFDFAYGASTWADDGRLDRKGWFATLLLESPMDWGTPGLYGWLSSGDSSNPAEGSRRMPALAPDNSITYSNFAFDGSPYLERNSVIGTNLAGTWGVGLRAAKLSWSEDLNQTIRINLIGGTNSPAMAKKMSLAGMWANGSLLQPEDLGQGAALGMPGLYMITRDAALELGTTASYQIYENFLFSFECAYVKLWLDTGPDCWGARHRNGQAIPETKDAWNVNASFVYQF